MSGKVSLRIAALGAVVALLAVLIPAGFAAGQTATVGELFTDEGVVEIRFGATDEVRWFGPAKTDGTRDLVGTPTPVAATVGCTVNGTDTFSSSSSLGALGIQAFGDRGSQPKLGFVDDGLGVNVKGEGSGQPCGRVDGTSQYLELKLTGGKEFAFAELDVEGKFGVTIQADLYWSALAATPSSESLVGTLLCVTAGGPDSGCDQEGSGADSGPDSADGDNFRWRLEADDGMPFDHVRLTVHSTTPSGAFSLEGGADGTEVGELGLTGSAFQLTDVEGMLGCGGTATDGDGVATPGVLLTRLDTGTCEAIPYNLFVSESDNSITFLKDLSGTSGAKFTMAVTWPPEEASMPVDPTQFLYPEDLYQDDSVEGEEEAVLLDVQWCEDTEDDPSTSIDERTGYDANYPVSEGNQPWCLMSQQVDLLSDGQIQVKEDFFGELDPKTLR